MIPAEEDLERAVEAAARADYEHNAAAYAASVAAGRIIPASEERPHVEWDDLPDDVRARFCKAQRHVVDAVVRVLG